MAKMTTTEVADILFEQIRGYYKGYPQEGEEVQFRRSLTGEEAQSLLSTIHNIITTIRLEEISEDKNSNGK